MFWLRDRSGAGWEGARIQKVKNMFEVEMAAGWPRWVLVGGMAVPKGAWISCVLRILLAWWIGVLLWVGS